MHAIMHEIMHAFMHARTFTCVYVLCVCVHQFRFRTTRLAATSLSPLGLSTPLPQIPGSGE